MLSILYSPDKDWIEHEIEATVSHDKDWIEHEIEATVNGSQLHASPQSICDSRKKKKDQRLPTLTWKTLSPFIHATNLDSVVLPAPLTPINSK